MWDEDSPLSFGALGLGHTVVAKIVGPAEPPGKTTFINRRVLGAVKVGLCRLALCTQACEAVENAKVQSRVKVAGSDYDQKNWMNE